MRTLGRERPSPPPPLIRIYLSHVKATSNSRVQTRSEVAVYSLVIHSVAGSQDLMATQDVYGRERRREEVNE